MKKNSIIALFVTIFCFFSLSVMAAEEPQVVYKGETNIQNWGPTNITVYGIPCPEEMTEFKNKKGMDQWVIDNVKFTKKGEGVVYFGELMGIVINAQYNDKNLWKGIQVTSVTLEKK